MDVIHEPIPVCDEELSRNMDTQDIPDIPDGQEPSIRLAVTQEQKKGET